MKRIFSKVIYIASLAFAVSCQSAVDMDNEARSKSEYGNVVITASLDNDEDDTKTLLSGTKVLWCDGDEFALLSSNGADKFTLASGAGTASAEFAGDVSGGTPYYGLYPYSSFLSLTCCTVNFNLPQVQTYMDNSFGKGASPAIATIEDLSAAAKFKNICGAIELNLAGSCTVSSIVVSAVPGYKLWGNCELALDGTEGTDNQTLNITGGSNEVILECPEGVLLKPSITKKFNIIVPPGSLSGGFTVKIIDDEGNVAAFLLSQNGVNVKRSRVTSMKKTRLPENGEPASVLARGYYKDVFQNGGCGLTSNITLPAAPYLGWTFDSMGTEGGGDASPTAADKAFQNRIVLGDENDLNGVLFYPDGKPRYRMVYFNGGKASTHGRSLGEAGRDAFIKFIERGGSYVGTCAGAFITSDGTTDELHSEYFGLIPSRLVCTQYYYPTGMFIPATSPLLKYYDFGGDLYVASVRQAGGAYLPDDQVPEKCEILMRYDSEGQFFHDKISVWAYKDNPSSGRLVACGGHPEQVEDGERRDMMAAMMRYACDGNGSDLNLKGTLSNGEPVVMDQLSTAGKPESARIGDRQYHHFKVVIPEGAKNVKLSLVGDGVHNFQFAMRKGAPAWRADAQYLLMYKGSNKEFSFDTLEPGEWYVSVYCPDTIPVECDILKFEYSGDISILNGVPYTLTASWE